MMDILAYLTCRLLGFIVSLLSYKQLNRVGKLAGSLAYYVHRPFRKKAMCSLAIAYGSTKNEKERKQIAKQSFQNLMITCLEFFRLKGSYGKLEEIAAFEENVQVRPLLEGDHGVIFLSAHQANWEIPFLLLTELYKGIAIGRPIKNKRLYRYILSIREMNGGKIVLPKNAIREGLRSLRHKEFLGIVGDQAYPESPYSYPLFGTRAWTASTPALLAYKTGSPLIVGTTVRQKSGRYLVSGSEPIWPNLSAPLKEEVERMMDLAMERLEKSIHTHPEQWMWVHDRWKQQGVNHIKRMFRYSFILVLLPKDLKPYEPAAKLLCRIYAQSFLTFCVHKGEQLDIPGGTIIEYDTLNELFLPDWRIQLVFDFYGSKKVRRHYLKLGAFQAISLSSMKSQATLEETIAHHVVKKESLEKFL